MTPKPKPRTPKRGKTQEAYTDEELHDVARRLVKEAARYEPDDAIVRELTRIWRKMGRKREKEV